MVARNIPTRFKKLSKVYVEQNPTYEQFSKKSGDVEIIRVAPKNSGAVIEFKNKEKKVAFIKLAVTEVETGKVAYEESRIYSHEANFFEAEKLVNGVDYLAEIIVCEKDFSERCRSNARLFTPGFFPGKVVNYLHQADLTFANYGKILGAPFIARFSNGDYVASHDYEAFGIATKTRSDFFISKNYGKSWAYASSLSSGVNTLFVHNDVLYALGMDISTGDLLISASDDEATTWKGPVIIAKGTERKGYRPTPNTFAHYNGRFWFYVGAGEYDKDDEYNYTAFTASIDENEDFLNPDAWVITESIKYDQTWKDAPPRWDPSMLEEGNVVVALDGELKVISRCNSHRYDAPELSPKMTYAVMFKVDKDNPEKPLEFERMIPFNGGLHKFFIQYDEKSKAYYALVNRMTNGHIWQRNVLSLAKSEDLIKWEFVRDLINLEDMEWYEEDWDAAFQYPTFFIENDDIVAVVRTALNGAENFHNNNCMTFHRFKKFKDEYKF